MKILPFTIACLISMLSSVFAEDIRIIDKKGNTSHPSIKCYFVKEYKGELGKLYLLVLPKDFTHDISLHIVDNNGDSIFMGSLEQNDGPGISNDPDARGAKFFLKLDYINKSKISMSGKFNGELKSYSLSLALPEQHEEAEQAAPRNR